MATVVTGGATPGGAEPILAPAAPEAPVVLSPSPEADFQAKARGAKSTTAVRALLNETLRAVPPKAPTPEAQPAAEATPAPDATPETPAAAEGETPPAAEPNPPEPQPAAPIDDDDNQPILDGPVEPNTDKRPRLRLPTNDKVGRLATSFQKRNPDWTLSQALDAANKQLGIKPETPPVAAPTPEGAAPKSDQPQTVEAADAALKALRAERKKANTELRFEEASDLNDKIEDLLVHRSNIERQAERQESQAVQTYHAKFAESAAQATELYPDAAKADSPFGQRMKEIDDVLEATGDPRFHAANKPLLCAQMVAAEMNIAPRRKGAPAAPAPKAAAPATGTPPAAPPPPKKGMVPGGASRTTPLATNQPPAIDAKIKAASTHGELRKVYRELGLRL